MHDKSYRHWWPRYVADYRVKTARLSLLEHGAYTLLLDEYYATEAPLPAHAEVLHRICRAITPTEQEAVLTVINAFFVLEIDGYHNKKADEQLAKRKDIKEKRVKAALARHANAHASAEVLHGKKAAHAAPTSTSTPTEDTVCVGPSRFLIFFENYPPEKRGNQADALEAYNQALSDNKTTEEEIHAGLKRYTESDELKRGIYTRADNWLKRHRWKNDYTAKQNASGHPNGNGRGRRPVSLVQATLRAQALMREEETANKA